MQLLLQDSRLFFIHFMKRMITLLDRVRCSRWAAAFAAAAGLLIYLIQSIQFARQLPSILDEGNYLYKGLLFAKGLYYPFQPYGPWTNKMPLAFLIPGWIQALFGPGLRTGRTYAVVLGLILLAALWLAARRFSGAWWAAGCVLLVAFLPGVISTYSQAWSQVLIAAMLIVVLALVLGPGRPLWQLLAGSALSALMVMTRQNMIPVAGLVALYLFWEYGWRKGLYASIAILLVLVAGHALFWPGILNIWRPWLPFPLPELTAAARPLGLAILPFLPVTGGLNVLVPSIQDFIFSFLYPLLEPLKSYFVPLVGTLAALVCWPPRKVWPSDSRFRASVLLAVMMLTLTVLHAWGALGHDYCPYCFNTYMAFFAPVGLLLVVVSAPAWLRRLSTLRQGTAILLALLSTTAMGYVLYPQLESLLTLQIPRVSRMRILPGTTDLWRSLANKFGWSYEILQRLIPSIAGLLAGILVTILAVLAVRWWRKRRPPAPSSGYLSLALVLALDALLSPLALVGGGNASAACQSDVIAAYEQAGASLAQIISPGALIYWKGGNSPVPLLYLPQARIFPPQLNGNYSYLADGNSDALYRKGYWNQELDNQWLDKANYILVEDQFYAGSFKKRIDPAKYNELPSTPPILACHPETKIRVFRREK